jgi:putative ABC transport system ATP-binding protein
VLADEPTGALDSSTGEAIMRVLRARVDAGAAGLLVTHEPQHAAWADRIVYLRDGVVVDVTAGGAASGGSVTGEPGDTTDLLFGLSEDLDEEPSR